MDKSERAKREEEILAFWQENKIFEKTLEKEAPKDEFVFYDGPPFATGLPHSGSLLSSVIKDVIPRYKTMRGYHVRRRWGWDCHGLPIENMIEKELGIKDKKEIETKFGIKAFNQACRDSVLRYAHDWKKYVDRVGRWVEYDNAYKTMDNTFIESVWQALKKINDKGLLYEGRKVLLYCPHCQTPIAKAEIAMDNSYKDVTEESVYVEFRVKGKENTSFLAWTTTPWTLPGNVALAVGADIDYVEIEKKDMGTGPLVRFIVAKDRLKAVFGESEYKVLREMKGRELIGMGYEPLYRITDDPKAYKVYEADFVNTEEGTGIVHTAILYGEDDYALGLQVGLPQVPLLDSAAHFNDAAPEFIRGQYFKKAEKAIKEDLEQRQLMFKREMHTHSYPHCHRCGTALLYNAISSWFINIQKVKSRMIALNEKVNWIPEHLKHGRFLNIVENAPDWTISRNRYWASPLPIWKDADGKVHIIGSIEELKKYSKKSGNTFFFVRHGEGEHNVLDICSSDPNNPHHITKRGKEHVRKTAERLKQERVDIIIRSPFIRAQETADIIAEVIGFDKGKITVDKRIQEYQFGQFNLKPWTEYLAFRKGHEFDMNFSIPGGETLQEAKNRFGDFLYDLDSHYSGKNIIVVTHGIGFQVVPTILEAMDPAGSATAIRATFRNIPDAFLEPFSVIRLPHNDKYELDLHRPYIDEVELVSEEGKPLKRIPEVLDGWVESASMPFAEHHYPFENKEEFEKHFPGDFIAEYIAQTRTWFYYMHAMATLLFDNQAFKNVVTTGTILAADGSKMSKSKGNYTDPLLLLDRIGADAFRYYLMSSVIMQAEDLSFKDEDVKDVQNRLINILTNSLTFYELYADGTKANASSSHVLDRWILARFHELVEEVTQAFDTFDTVRATRPVKDFVTDLSTWYIRRSRDRFKGEDAEDKKRALATSRYIFLNLAKIIAPVMPFVADEIYRKVREDSDPASVHLAEWPEVKKPLLSMFKKKDDVFEQMAETRRITSLVLEARNAAGHKVRQPLRELRVNAELTTEYLEILKDELNVKEVVIDKNLSEKIILDTNLTPELLKEGKVRDAIRAVQEWRKEQNLKPGEKAQYPTHDEFMLAHKAEIEKATNVELSHLHN